MCLWPPANEETYNCQREKKQAEELPALGVCIVHCAVKQTELRRKNETG